jgi:prepilin-type N-terminal cleavage/methylation domain-containing protein
LSGTFGSSVISNFPRSVRGAPTSRGFTLVEVMIASVVLVLAITTSITTLQHGLQAVDTARGYTYASQVMQSEMERLRLKSWAQLQTLQDARETSVAASTVAGAPAATFSCTRSIRDVKTDMKEIILESNWRGYDGRPHTARFVTRYGKAGLYDYFYTAH